MIYTYSVSVKDKSILIHRHRKAAEGTYTVTFELTSGQAFYLRDDLVSALLAIGSQPK